MTLVAEIPLVGGPERFSLLVGGDVYLLRLHFSDARRAGWMLDVADASGSDLVCGIPLLPGFDLLGPYAHLGIQGKLYLRNDEDFASPPTFGAIGTTAHLMMVTAP